MMNKPMYKTGGMNNPNKMAQVNPKKGSGKKAMPKKMGKKK